jgi:hypothetical protein
VVAKCSKLLYTLLTLTQQEHKMADKGIRPYCNFKFAEMLPLRVNTRAGNTAFRKTVMCELMEQFSITLASASTHYNHSFQCAGIPLGEYITVTSLQGVVTRVGPGLGIPVELLVGLGRAADKKGGAKAKVKAVVAVAAPVLLLGYTPSVTPSNTMDMYGYQATQAAFAALAVQAAEAVAHVAEVVAEPVVEELVQTAFNVCKKSDGSMVAEGLSFEDAKALVAKNAAQRKAKLYWV